MIAGSRVGGSSLAERSIVQSAGGVAGAAIVEPTEDFRLAASWMVGPSSSRFV